MINNSIKHILKCWKGIIIYLNVNNSVLANPIT